MKTYLEAYYTGSNVTLDDGSTGAEWHVMYGRPVEFIWEILLEKHADVLLTVEEGTPATPIINSDLVARGYEQSIPVRAWCIDKYDGSWTQTITGTVLKAKVEIEMRLILETYPAGSQYRIERMQNVDEDLGGDRLYGLEVTVNYRRSITA